MRRVFVLAVCDLLLASSQSLAGRRSRNAPDFSGSMHQSAAVGSTVLGFWQFDTPTGIPTPQGWTTVDRSVKEATSNNGVFAPAKIPWTHSATPVSSDAGP